MMFVVVTAMMITTTTAVYAQQGKACPPGFELKRGICQAEPTPAPLGCEEGYELVDGDICRTLEPTRFHQAFCPDGSSLGSYTHPELGFISSCLLLGSSSPFEDNDIADPTCDTLFVAENEVVELQNYERPNFRHETICAFYEVVEPVPQGEPTCDIGTLNEESALCEIKPGRA